MYSFVVKHKYLSWGMVEMRSAYKILIKKSEWKNPLGRPKHRWEDIIVTKITS
jgi:hypothetical protein